MFKINNYSIKGTKLEALSLPKDFSEKINLTLLAQAIRVYEEKAHPGLAKLGQKSIELKRNGISRRERVGPDMEPVQPRFLSAVEPLTAQDQ
jgi:hypothetical protein